jgi:hypothetical protein
MILILNAKELLNQLNLSWTYSILKSNLMKIKVE